MQPKYLCAPLLLVSALASHAAPAPLPTLSSSVPIGSAAVPPVPANFFVKRRPFSSVTITGVKLGSRTERLGSQAKPAPNSLLSIHGAPDAVLIRGQGGFVLRDVKAGRETTLGASLNANLPAWAASVAPEISAGHEAWLYNRGTYSMGFMIDPLRFVDAITVAGSGAKRPPLEAKGITGTLSLGDDLRHAMRRFGYPNSIQSFDARTPDGRDVIPSLRTFELRYGPQTQANYKEVPSVVITVRSNRVARFYAFLR